MKTLTHCPICNNVLYSTYTIIHKNCDIYSDHKFYSTTSVSNENKLQYMQISVNMIPYAFAFWNFKHKKLSIRKYIEDNIGCGFTTLYIPYFNPSQYINNYDKLLNKIKTYVIFS
jgi:hypothetical protein